MTSPSPSIRLEGVDFGYARGASVLNGIELELRSGLILLLGPNGHGKSTLLKLLAGVERPDGGRLWISGLDLWQQEAEARSRLAYVPEHPDITPYASVREVLALSAALRGETAERVDELMAAMDLSDELARRSIRELSKGQRRRVLLVAALLGRPEILLLDEPLDALDRKLRADLLARLDQRLKQGALIVVVTHELEPCVELASSAVAMRHGQATVYDSLPESPTERMDFLESLARGQAP